jgi:signal peptidase I
MKRRIIEVVMAVGVMAAAAVIEYAVLIVWDARPARAFKNVSRSMEPALLAGDRFTIRTSIATSSLLRGDLVAHDFPADRSTQFVKRLVGLPGDTLAVAHGRLMVNGKLVQEPYAWIEDSTTDPASDDFRWQRRYVVGAAARDTARYVASRDNWGPLAIPPASYFVLGDNRDNSLDSRYVGFVRAEDIVGTVRRVYFSQDSIGHIRWSRFGLQPR